MTDPAGNIVPLRPAADEPRLPPANTEAEQALLGAILINNRAYEHVVDLVRPEDFANAVHGRIFAAIGQLVADGRPANPITLAHVFAQDETLAAAGGARYLVRLAEEAVSIINAPHYARTIADLARRRALIMIGQDLVADAFRADLVDDSGQLRTAETIIDAAEQSLYELAERSAQGAGPRRLSQVVAETVQAIEAAHRAGGAIVVDTGLVRIDSIIAGLGAGDLVVLAGRPGMGKSALAGTIACNVARGGKRVLLFSLEMTRHELSQRWIAGWTGIATDRQRHGRLDGVEWRSLVDAQAALAQLPILVDDQPRLSVPQMRQRARRIKRRHGLDLIVVDHLQLVRQPGRQESRRTEIGDASSMLKALAKELGVPVLLLSQLSRATESRDDKRPMLSDLKESGDIEQDADVVIFLYREAYYLERQEPKRRRDQTTEAFETMRADWQAHVDRAVGLADVIIAKNRHGATGIASVAWLPERQRFENLQPGEGYGGFA